MENFGKLILRDEKGNEKEFSISSTSAEIGRGTFNDIILLDEKISRSHARIEFDEKGGMLTDLGSANGTFVNDERIEKRRINPGDVIGLGNSTLRFENDTSVQDADEHTPHSDPDKTILNEGPDETIINTKVDLDAILAQHPIKTVLGDVTKSRLVIHTPQKTWEVSVEDVSLVIGRDPSCDIVIDDERLSRKHAEVVGKGAIFTLRDLDSSNGIWLIQKRIDEPYTLRDSDEIHIGQTIIVFKKGFKPQDLTFAGSLASIMPGRRPVVFVPGFAGSQLWRGSERLWPNIRLLVSQPEKIQMLESNPIEARGIVEEVVVIPNFMKQEVYGLLGDYFVEGLGYERERDFFEFAYDWRLDVRESARKLAEVIESWDIDPPFTLIAHSLGCLVSRYYIDRLGGKDKIGRLIMLGGPHSGIPDSLKIFQAGRNILPFGIMQDRLRETLISFPSIYQILPTYPCVIDQDGNYINLFKDEGWLPEKHRSKLRLAKEFLQELKSNPSVPTISIFGYGMETIAQVKVHRESDGTWKNVEFIDATGDDRIPQSTAIFKGSEIHPVQQHHGSLFVDNDVKMRLKLELTRDSGF